MERNKYKPIIGFYVSRQDAETVPKYVVPTNDDFGRETRKAVEFSRASK